MTPLLISSKKGITDVVLLLLDKGADLHATDEVHSTRPVESFHAHTQYSVKLSYSISCSEVINNPVTV